MSEMAKYTSNASNNDQFVAWLRAEGMITDDAAEAAFQAVDRAHYATYNPYMNLPSPLGYWSVTSAPSLQTSAIKTLLPFLRPDVTGTPSPRRVLDIGCGSGYTTHLLAELAGDEGIVVGVENIEQLRVMGVNNLKKTERGRQLLDTGRVVFLLGDGRQGLADELREGIRGIDKETKWDVIHVAASSEDMPEELMRQLKSPGCMFIPLKNKESTEKEFVDAVWKIEKDENGSVTKTIIHPRAYYVKLADAPEQVDDEEKMKQPGYGLGSR